MVNFPIKLLGNDFFLIAFDNPIQWVATLKEAPWYMYHTFAFMVVWNPNLDVHNDFKTKIPIWIELLYRAFILEWSRETIIELLGPILHFIKDDALSCYSHNKACILWDAIYRSPKWLKIWLDSNHFI